MSTPVNTPLINGNELKYVTECINTGWVSSEGSFVTKFEELFSAYVQRKHGIAVANGSAALDIAVKALDITIGDEVIVPTFTIISPVQSIINAGAKPVLVDSDLSTWNMDVSQIEAKITYKTKAILVVHIYSHPVDMDPILALVKKYNLKLIEDAAEMHGQTYKGKPCGSFGDISTFSFYANKHITTGEGGMLVCNDAKLAERCRKLRNLCFDPDKRRFFHEELGWNYRITNIQAALGLAQLENVAEKISRKKKLGKYYHDSLAPLKKKGYQFSPEKTSYSDNIYWVFGILAPTEEQQIRITDYLSKNKIGNRPFFWCMHEQPVFLKMGLFKDEKYPNAELLARRGFYIPSGIGLTNDEAQIVTQTLLNAPF